MWQLQAPRVRLPSNSQGTSYSSIAACGIKSHLFWGAVGSKNGRCWGESLSALLVLFTYVSLLVWGVVKK